MLSTSTNMFLLFGNRLSKCLRLPLGMKIFIHEHPKNAFLAIFVVIDCIVILCKA